MVPRKYLVKGTAAVRVKRRVSAAFLKNLQPFFQTEAVAPAVKVESALTRKRERFAELSVSARENRLQEARICIVIVKGDFLRGDALLNVRLLSWSMGMVSCGSHWNGVKGLGTKDEADTVTRTDFPFARFGV